jgi:hypothetical protein
MFLSKLIFFVFYFKFFFCMESKEIKKLGNDNTKKLQSDLINSSAFPIITDFLGTEILTKFNLLNKSLNKLSSKRLFYTAVQVKNKAFESDFARSDLLRYYERHILKELENNNSIFSRFDLELEIKEDESFFDEFLNIFIGLSDIQIIEKVKEMNLVIFKMVDGERQREREYIEESDFWNLFYQIFITRYLEGKEDVFGDNILYYPNVKVDELESIELKRKLTIFGAILARNLLKNFPIQNFDLSLLIVFALPKEEQEGEFDLIHENISDVEKYKNFIKPFAETFKNYFSENFYLKISNFWVLTTFLQQ